MSPIENFKISIVVVAVLLAGNNLPNRASAAGPATPTHCAAPSYRQFDFWAGDWDVFDVGSPIQVAHAKVDLILDGCVLREDYQGTDGHKGQSFTIYDVARDVWHQTWVTNRGELLQIEGKLDAGVIAGRGNDTGRHPAVKLAVPEDARRSQFCAQRRNGQGESASSMPMPNRE